jgi:hypothetical protein
MIFKNNRVYDVLKWCNAILIPALITLIATVGKSLAWEDVVVVVAICNAVNTFLGSVLGVSNYQYNQASVESLELPEDENVYVDHEDKGVM